MKVVVGLGRTGLSCIDYLVAQGQEVLAMDCDQAPATLAELQQKHPNVKTYLGGLDRDILQKAEEIILSPGVPQALPEIQAAKQQGVPVVGDIELFMRVTKAPIYAVTGSNGKTTVTTLLGEIARQDNQEIKTAGNIGVPVLDLLKTSSATGYILELSSFQLETTYSLHTKAAVVLNVTPDHMDRYQSFEEYQQAKLKIYQHCECPIVNLDDPLSHMGVALNSEAITFSVTGRDADYRLMQEGSKIYLAYRNQKVLDTSQLPLQGYHHYQNALCALSFARVMGVREESVLQVLRDFRGLAHRCQLVRIKDGVFWYNDSKGTNVGATLSALQSVSEKAPGKKIILLAGGLAKDADFSPLQDSVKQKVKSLILFGRDANLLANSLQHVAPIAFSKSLEEAVAAAQHAAEEGDCVLLSPACASFDMFSSYVDRGNQFIKLVEDL